MSSEKYLIMSWKWNACEQLSLFNNFNKKKNVIIWILETREPKVNTN